MGSSRTLRDIEFEIQRRQFEDPLKLVYVPHDIQQTVHQSRLPITVVLGGNRSGKSWSAVAESQYYCTGRRAWAEVPDVPVYVWYAIPSLTMFRRSILPIFRRLAPQREIKRFYQRDAIVLYHNGSELHFVSTDMEAKRLQGASIDLAIMDETPNERIYDELQARVADRRGRLLIAFAPIPEQIAEWAWVRDSLYLPWVAGDRRDVEVIFMPVATREGKSLVPWFTDEDIKDLERKWPDPAVRSARLYGELLSRSGLVLRGFHPDTHLVTPFDIPKNYARWMVIDPQYHRFAALYFAADDRGNYYVTNEYFSQDETLAVRAERLKTVVGEREQAVPAYVDSANPQDCHELNWHFRRIGAPIGAVQLPIKKQVDKLILRVHALLEPDDERRYPAAVYPEDKEDAIPYGAPRLFFFDDLISMWKFGDRDMHCSRLLWEVQRLAWGRDGRPDKDTANGGDCTDCLNYGCSILQVGVKLPEQELWQRGLSDADILLWKAIDQYDRRPRWAASHED